MLTLLECKMQFDVLIDCLLQDYSYSGIKLTLTILIFVIIWWTFNYRYNSQSRQISHSDDQMDKYYALTKAILENNVINCIRILQENPKFINKRHNSDGYTPFMRACLMGKTQLVLFMLERGADIDARTLKLETPFYLAAFNLIQNPTSKDASCIRALFYAHCDINATNYKGLTPLHLAAMFGHNGLVKWLLNKGAHSSIQPCPYTIARLQGHFETAMILKNKILWAIEGK